MSEFHRDLESPHVSDTELTPSFPTHMQAHLPPARIPDTHHRPPRAPRSENIHERKRRLSDLSPVAFHRSPTPEVTVVGPQALRSPTSKTHVKMIASIQTLSVREMLRRYMPLPVLLLYLVPTAIMFGNSTLAYPALSMLLTPVIALALTRTLPGLVMIAAALAIQKPTRPPIKKMALVPVVFIALLATWAIGESIYFSLANSLHISPIRYPVETILRVSRGNLVLGSTEIPKALVPSLFIVLGLLTAIPVLGQGLLLRGAATRAHGATVVHVVLAWLYLNAVIVSPVGNLVTAALLTVVARRTRSAIVPTLAHVAVGATGLGAVVLVGMR
ncbi:hypothetical protein J8273_6249 [Carpediemonas membranifera]|uniref:Uncharacterized protein n=1 Tax=Carpediemonas membranifera TaxID=201153 RepID=A0A8J6AYF6_9EUKA|nr:hypothetical protein J8273_6249 [Carpediemonas membranifera]|eukprot:KAG9391488.1 hypothetical protein J8273_6249 [Carpediemonas membranifera]